MKISWEETQAAWTLGNLTREELPSIAADMLEQGFDHPSLRRLAGLTKAEADEVWPLFKKVVAALGNPDMNDGKAFDIFVRWVSRRILANDLTPYAGARQIWMTSHKLPTNHDVDTFIYAASEFMDRPEDQEYFAQVIRDEAAERVACGKRA